jgi:hypothetical protein
MSWGKIYCSTWWGDYKNIQHSIPDKADCLYPYLVQEFITRVEADGGTVEGKECLANSLISLGYDSNNQLSEQYADDFIDRIVADSGSVEDRWCLVEYINNLLNL